MQPRAAVVSIAPDSFLCRWRIRYHSSTGQQTERVVRVDTVYPRAHRVSGWCELRLETRTFSLFGIDEAVDLQSGSVVDLGAFLEAYRRGDLTLVERLSAANRAIASHQEALAVLHYLALVDGRYSKNDRRAINDFLKSAHDCSEQVRDEVTLQMRSWGSGSAIKFGKDLAAVSSASIEYRQAVSAAAVFIHTFALASAKTKYLRPMSRLTESLVAD